MCQEPLDVGESLFVQEVGDWRKPYLYFLQQFLLPTNRSDAMKIKSKTLMFMVDQGLIQERLQPSTSQMYSK